MLVEMFSPVFMERGEVRPPIRFKERLNVVLGKEDGANSIGKPSAMLVALFNRNKDIQVYCQNLAEEKKKLDVFKEAGKYHFISNLVGGKEKYEENLALIRDLEIQLSTLTEQADQGHTEDEIAKGQQKAVLDAQRLMLETELQAKQRKLKLASMSLEYGLYPTEADLSALQEFFPNVNLRKLYEMERYHQKLAQILDEQFPLSGSLSKEKSQLWSNNLQR